VTKFKLHESNGNWMVTQDSENVSFFGGEEIDYAMYQKLRDKPHEADKYFQRDAKGKLSLRKDAPKDKI
jgi:hypothetical protein